MTFTSFNFLFFFPVVLILCYLTPKKIRWITLLIASYFFYLNLKPSFAIITAGVTVVTYIFARLISAASNDSLRRKYMVTGIILVLAPLFFFKYYSTINSAIYIFLENNHIRLHLPEIELFLPVGISFYTFMALGYIVDVYNEETECEKNIGILALFVSFFPLILSGPIERAKNMIPQFKNMKSLDYDLFVKGLKFILWGYFMKLVIADRIGIYVDAVYNNILQHNGTTLLFASLLYPFQVYADLGGYSLIAIGIANALGIRVIQNFNRPFFARTMSDFWRRWHISLICWLKDYVYTPLSFLFRGYRIWGIVIALMATFLISGIWHGPSLNFIVWGLLQGIFLSVEALMNKKKLQSERVLNLTNKAWYIIFGICSTFILFSASQIFARTRDIEEALLVYYRIFSTRGPLFIGTPSTIVYIMGGLIMLFIKDLADELAPSRFLLFESKYNSVRILSYASIIILILLIGVFDGGQFLYFQF